MKIFLEALLSTVFTLIFTYALSPLIEQNKGNKIFLLIFSLVFLLVYSVIFSNSHKIKLLLKRCKRIVFPKIGILNGNIDTEVVYMCERVWTNVTPAQWQVKLSSLLKEKLPKLLKILFWITRHNYVKLIDVCEISDDFTIIINSFGDNFPEEDTEMHSTFLRLRQFMNNGGIFVVTGGAFYYHQNTKSSPNREQPIIKEHIAEGCSWQSLNDTILKKKFGVNMTSDAEGDKKEVGVYQLECDKKIIGDLGLNINNVLVKRFRALKGDSSSNFLPILREKEEDNFPIALIVQKKGYLLHIGLYLENEEGSELKLTLEVISRLFIKGVGLSIN